MTISVAQAAGNLTDNAAAASRATASNVTAGNLVVVLVWRWVSSGTPDQFLAGDCTQTAGTATLGTIALDVEDQLADGSLDFSVGIWSAIVTQSGSLTIDVAGGAGDYYGISIVELAATNGWDASRLEGINTAATGSNNVTPADSGNAASAGGAAFLGVLLLNGNNANQIAVDAAFTLVFEEDTTALSQNGSSMYRLVTSGTTDSASWTLGTGNGGWIASLAVYREVAAAAGVDEDFLPGLLAPRRRTTGFDLRRALVQPLFPSTPAPGALPWLLPARTRRTTYTPLRLVHNDAYPQTPIVTFYVTPYAQRNIRHSGRH